MKIQSTRNLAIIILISLLNMNSCGDLEIEESTEDSESHYPGTDCGSCHGNQAKGFSISGTIYTDSTGTTPAKGRKIIIRDQNNVEILRLTSDQTGNFYTNKTIIYPARAESLSSGIAMSNSFKNTESSCNKSGCHDSTRRIY